MNEKALTYILNTITSSLKAMSLQKSLLPTKEIEHSNCILILICFIITSHDTYVQNLSISRLAPSILCIRKCT